MIKNTAGQAIDAHLINKSDGSDVTTGTTTVYVTGDNGTQAAGGGTVAHVGNGVWRYTPTQAETNNGHVTFTFINSLAVSQSVQIWPMLALQSGDVYPIASHASYGNAALNTKIGTPANASVSADLAAINSTITRPTFTVVADAGNTANSFKTDLPSSVSDFYQNLWVKPISGALDGSAPRRITIYNGTTKFITLNSSYTSTPAAGVVFEIISE